MPSNLYVRFSYCRLEAYIIYNHRKEVYMPNILPETKVRGSLLVDNIIPRAEDIPRARS